MREELGNEVDPSQTPKRQGFLPKAAESLECFKSLSTVIQKGPRKLTMAI